MTEIALSKLYLFSHEFENSAKYLQIAQETQSKIELYETKTAHKLQLYLSQLKVLQSALKCDQTEQHLQLSKLK